MTSNPLSNKKRPPASVRAMNQWVRDAVSHTGRAERRVSWTISSTVVVAALQRALGNDSAPLFLVKGGVYVEFNLKERFYPDDTQESLKTACLDIFTVRAEEAEILGRAVRHWPPIVAANQYWIETYPPLAASLGITLTLDQAIAIINAWIVKMNDTNLGSPQSP